MSRRFGTRARNRLYPQSIFGPVMFGQRLFAQALDLGIEWRGFACELVYRSHDTMLGAASRREVGTLMGSPMNSAPTIAQSSSAPNTCARPGSLLIPPVLQSRTSPSATAASAMLWTAQQTDA